MAQLGYVFRSPTSSGLDFAPFGGDEMEGFEQAEASAHLLDSRSSYCFTKITCPSHLILRNKRFPRAQLLGNISTFNPYSFEGITLVYMNSYC